MPRYDDWKKDVQGELVDTFGERRLRNIKRWVIFFIILAILGGTFSCHIIRNARAAGHDIIDKTINADNIMYNYQWFYDQYNAIKAQKANLNAVDSKSMEYSGMIMVLNRNIAEYNSKSSQINRNLWKAPGLPQTISLEDM